MLARSVIFIYPRYFPVQVADQVRRRVQNGCSHGFAQAVQASAGQSWIGVEVGEQFGGRGTRLALLIASPLAGLVIALLTVHLAGRWQ
jgi:hypothetical protein